MDADPPVNSAKGQDLLPAELPVGRPVETDAGRTGPVTGENGPGDYDIFVPVRIGRVPATDTSVLATEREIDAIIEQIKSG